MSGGVPVLFVSRQRLVGRTNGSSAYLLDLAQTCRAQGFEPYLLQPTPRVAGRWPVLRMGNDMQVFASHRIRGLVQFGNLFVAPSLRVWLAAGQAVLARVARRLGMRGRLFADKPFPYVVAEDWTDADRRWLARAASGQAAAVIADYMFCAPAFGLVPGASASAIVMHDLFHSRAGAKGDTVALVDRQTELELLGRADVVIAIQEGEACWVRENLPGTEVVVAPMAAEIAPTASAGGDGHLLFVGSNTGPNIEGLRWFLDAVWPAVRAAIPDARLDVAGTVNWSFPEGAPGVRFLGMVDALEPLYRDAGVIISPLTFGSGLKIKLVEAMAHGKAIVATPVTMQGVEEIGADAVACAETAEAFADAVIRLAGDSSAREQLAERALVCARAHFSRETSHAAFASWLRSAAGRPATPSAGQRAGRAVTQPA